MVRFLIVSWLHYFRSIILRDTRPELRFLASTYIGHLFQSSPPGQPLALWRILNSTAWQLCENRPSFRRSASKTKICRVFHYLNSFWGKIKKFFFAFLLWTISPGPLRFNSVWNLFIWVNLTSNSRFNLQNLSQNTHFCITTGSIVPFFVVQNKIYFLQWTHPYIPSVILYRNAEKW